MVNLSAIVDFHARRDPDRLAILYADQRIGYRELAERAGVLAGLLAQLGVGPGDIVAAFMKNSSAFVELAIAVSHVGGVFLPLNFRLALEEAAYIVEHAGARRVFVDREFAEHAAGLPGVVVVDEQSQRDSRALAPLRPDVPPRTYRTPDDLFRLMYTSGTTDRPKGVMHTYANFYWKCMDHVAAIGLSASDRLLIVGPLYHVGAFDLPGLAVLWLGGMLCIHRDFDAAQALAAIECKRLTGAWLAPVMLTRILNLEGRGKFDLSSLKWCIGGGEKTPEARIKDFGNLFRNGRYIDAYGLTETCSGDTLMEAGREIERIGSTGRATSHVEIEIRDPSGGKLGPGLEGEICLRGPKITKGYWRDPEKTKSSFFGDWFRSGDIGHLDAEGFLYIIDRKKDMIKSGGENIASSEVERVIYQMPEVSEAAVIGLPDDKWGERPVAVVVLREGATLDYPTLEAHCGRHLARFKLPKELHLRSSLPRNPSGKVLKRVLRDEFMAVSPKRRNESC